MLNASKVINLLAWFGTRYYLLNCQIYILNNSKIIYPDKYILDFYIFSPLVYLNQEFLTPSWLHISFAYFLYFTVITVRPEGNLNVISQMSCFHFHHNLIVFYILFIVFSEKKLKSSKVKLLRYKLIVLFQEQYVDFHFFC